MKKTLLILSLYFPVFGFTQSWTDQSSSITNDLNGICFIDDNNGWAVGRQGKVVHTTNGGINWAEQNSGTTKDLNRISMVSNSIGFAVGDGGTVIKYNGTSWSTIGINYSQDMYGVQFLDANTGWISGDYGRIMKTTDGGNTWTTEMDNSTYTNTFNDIFMLNSQEGWVAGSGGRILKYDGTHWTSVSNPAADDFEDLYAISFSGSGAGFSGGQNSTMIGWYDSSWNSQNTSIPDNSAHIYDVHMISNNLGYAVTTHGFGGQGMILKYNGTTWSTDYQYGGANSELFTGITSTPNGNLYAVGATGMIKAKTSGGSTTTSIAKHTSNTEVTVFPNPFHTSLKINYPAAQQGQITITLRDLDGKILKTVSVNASETADHTITLNGEGLSKGLYFYTLTTPSETLCGKVIKDY